MTDQRTRLAYRERRYAILFYSLLLTLVAEPILGALRGPGALVELLLAGNLVAAGASFEPGRRRRLLLAVIALSCFARPATATVSPSGLSVMTLGIWTIVGLVAAAGALTFALRAAAVTSEHIYAALSAYLLAGMFFGLSYWVLEQVAPGSVGPGGGLSRSGAIYFSFVTLATLGYGDIVPVGDVARGIAVVEGIGGQLFLAVMVARLVSVYAGKR